MHDMRRAVARLVALTLVIALAAGCNVHKQLAMIAPPDADSAARGFIDTLEHQPPEAVIRYLMPELAALDGVTDSIRSAQSHLPVGASDSLELVDGRFNVIAGGPTYRQLMYQVHAGGKWAAVGVRFNEFAGRREVSALRVWSLTGPMQEINTLTVAHASFAGLLAFLWAAATVVACVYAAVQVLRSPLKQRWLWVLVAILGFGKISVTWSGAVIEVQWLAVQLFGAAAGRQGLYGQWWVAISFPGGAALALDRRRRAIAALAQPEPVPPPPEPPAPVAPDPA
jgi:hypothetical protein